MFCPGCSSEEREGNQFCRKCGTDLVKVRRSLESSDRLTASAASAREEIGRAIALKIRETTSAQELALLTRNVLPQIEEFLESPEEIRLRRLRAGSIVSCIGFGAAGGLTAVAYMVGSQDLLFLAALGAITFFIGLGLLINAIFLTIPSTTSGDVAELDPVIRRPDYLNSGAADSKDEPSIPSVTEHTTRHLEENQTRAE